MEEVGESRSKTDIMRQEQPPELWGSIPWHLLEEVGMFIWQDPWQGSDGRLEET
jgi:hypothetical protein